MIQKLDFKHFAPSLLSAEPIDLLGIRRVVSSRPSIHPS